MSELAKQYLLDHMMMEHKVQKQNPLVLVLVPLGMKELRYLKHHNPFNEYHIQKKIDLQYCVSNGCATNVLLFIKYIGCKHSS